MPSVAKIATHVALDKTFDYLIPPALVASVALGSRVLVPFGRTQATGFVVGLADRSERTDLKAILALTDPLPLIDPPMLKLARWIADYYCAAQEQVLKTMLPAPVRKTGSQFKAQLMVKAVRSREAAGISDLSAKQLAVMESLWTVGPQALQALARALNITAAPVRSLEKKGWVAIADETVARSPQSLRTLVRTPPLALMAEQAAALAMIVEMMGGAGGGSEVSGVGCPAFAKATAGVQVSGGADGRGDGSPQARPPMDDTITKLEGEAGGGEGVSGVRVQVSGGAGEGAGAAAHPEGSPYLDENKREVGRGVTPSHPAGVILLHGVTGSGKTEVYLQAIARALETGRGAIVLVPEIALTPQTIDRFVARFGDQVAVLHSHLSDGERHDEWHRIRSGAARIVVGARSAVFAPVKPLGIIVVDEEHEPSYKQEDTPRYNARDVAVMRGRLEGCTVVLGSATPALESWTNAQKGKYRLATLPVRVDDRRMPAIQIVDMRVNAERVGHVSVFSKELMDAIHARLSRAEQTILFLNRRGFATSLTCPKCGFTAQCDQCSVAVTYHRQDERLRCHLCGNARVVPAACPQCADPAFRYAGFGTQRVETIVAKCFPKARTVRMDTDVTGAKGSHDRILGDFRAGKIDILIGTQMIAKGLDFPNVTLVGVVQADLSLHMPDFRAAERTYQLLAQVAGRAGRGAVPGEVIVQTYTPHHPAMQAVRRNDFTGFCDMELEFRRELHYPPFSRLVCVTFRGVAETSVSYYAGVVAKKLTEAVGERVRVAEVCPAPIARIKGVFRYQLMIRGNAVSAITAPLREIMRANPPPKDVKCAVDVDALSLL